MHPLLQRNLRRRRFLILGLALRYGQLVVFARTFPKIRNLQPPIANLQDGCTI